ncbi:MAG: glycosyltransferase [Thermoplasmatales archaeon]|nr:MAG: glycosyltransferase [Thermoplasmatales archaeon]
MLITIIVPVKNEENNIIQALDKLVIQEQPIEIIVIDAESTDNTQQFVQKYEKKYPFIKLFIKGGKRGVSMNYAIEQSKGQAIAFIGADDQAQYDWIHNVRNALKKNHDIIIGQCKIKGKKKFKLDRVKIFYKDFDISAPGTNTTYKKEILQKIGGFDLRFVTAEDIDLNLRAVDANYKLFYEKKAIVYRYLRKNSFDLMKQSFWNGYGRKQLAMKHGRLWKKYSPQQTFLTHFSLYGLIRLLFGFFGYATCKISGGGMK